MFQKTRPKINKSFLCYSVMMTGWKHAKIKLTLGSAAKKKKNSTLVLSDYPGCQRLSSRRQFSHITCLWAGPDFSRKRAARETLVPVVLSGWRELYKFFGPIRNSVIY